MDGGSPFGFGQLGGSGATGSVATLAPVGTANQPTIQISVLEVFGEDSDSRKKRFESSLHDNRYIELKPLREAQRERDIASGVIPDPLKPRRLDQATDFVGTCVDMCPQFEREEREYQNNVDLLERYPGTTRIDPARAVKAFHRPAAGNDQPLPSDVRPPAVLRATLDYLFRELMPRHDFAASHPFLRDRTRAVRQDFTMQNERGTVAIECNERIARYHVLALGIQREQSGFSESQELEQLRKVLKSLNEFYDDARLSDPPIPTPNEAEFRSYNILTHLRDPDIIWSTELLPPDVFHHALLQTALKLHALAQRSSLPRGERASPNAFSRLFKLIESPQVPYLFGCLLSSHFGEVRRNALEALRNAYLVQHSGLPARRLVKMLGCDDEDEVREICETFGVATEVGEDGQLLAQLNKTTPLKSGTLKGHVSQRIVETKRGSHSYPDVIDGLVESVEPVAPIPTSPRSTSALAPRFTAATPLPSRPSSTAPTSRPPFLQPQFAASPFAPAMNSPFGAVSALPKLAAPVSTPIPSFPSTRAPSPALPVLSAFGPSLFPPAAAPKGKLNPVAAAFVPPTRSPFGGAPAAPAMPNTFGLPSAPPKPPAEKAPAPLQPPASVLQPTFSHFGVHASASSPLTSVETAKTLVPAAKPPPAAPPPATPVRPGISPLSTTPSAAAPPPPIHKVRDPLVVAKMEGVVLMLADFVVRAAVAGPVRRAAEDGLAWRWKEEQLTRQRLVAEYARGLAEWVVGMTVHAATRRVGREEVEQRETKRSVLEGWRVGAERRKVRKLEEEERRRRFKVVAMDIGVGPKYDGEDVDDGVSVSSSRLRGLTLGQAGPDRARAENSLATKIETAQLERDRLWAPATFLDILADRVEPSLGPARHALAARPTWTTIVSTQNADSAFASWLSCKFGLDETSRSIMVESPAARVEVHMLQAGEDPGQLLETTGLVVFECLQPSGVDDDSFWSAARVRLRAVVSATEACSVYPASVLILTCPSRKLSAREQSQARAEVVARLRPDEACLKPGRVGVWVVALQGGEEGQLERHLAQLLPAQVQLRTERVRCSLEGLVRPLADVWRAAVQEALAAGPAAAPPASVLVPYVDTLNATIADARACAIDPANNLPPVPPPPTDLSLLHGYILQPAFARAAHFPLLLATLAERPVPPARTRVRLMLEHLADWAVQSAKGVQARQGTLEAALEPALARLRARLAQVEVARPAGAGKKRKASLGPGLAGEDGARGAKQRLSAATPVFTPAPGRANGAGVNGARAEGAGPAAAGGVDRLSALELLMREARGLLGAK